MVTSTVGIIKLSNLWGYREWRGDTGGQRGDTGNGGEIQGDRANI